MCVGESSSSASDSVLFSPMAKLAETEDFDLISNDEYFRISNWAGFDDDLQNDMPADSQQAPAVKTELQIRSDLITCRSEPMITEGAIGWLYTQPFPSRTSVVHDAGGLDCLAGGIPMQSASNNALKGSVGSPTAGSDGPHASTGGPRSYRKHTTELINQLEKMITPRKANIDAGTGKSKSKRQTLAASRPRARNVLLQETVALIKCIQRDEQALRRTQQQWVMEDSFGRCLAQIAKDLSAVPPVTPATADGYVNCLLRGHTGIKSAPPPPPLAPAAPIVSAASSAPTAEVSSLPEPVAAVVHTAAAACAGPAAAARAAPQSESRRDQWDDFDLGLDSDAMGGAGGGAGGAGGDDDNWASFEQQIFGDAFQFAGAAAAAGGNLKCADGGGKYVAPFGEETGEEFTFGFGLGEAGLPVGRG